MSRTNFKKRTEETTGKGEEDFQQIAKEITETKTLDAWIQKLN